MKKKVCSVILILILSITGDVYAKESKNIIIDENGFSPTEITVNSGDEIVFINQGQKEHWPASNMHPSHGIYPEFDPKKTIKPGETWSFIFNTSGDWGMHDHLDSKWTGRISVMGEEVEDGNFNSGKFSINELFFDLKVNVIKRIPPLKNYYSKKISLIKAAHSNNEEKMRFIISIFSQKEVADKLVEESIQQGIKYKQQAEAANCHNYAHKFGREYFKMYGPDFFKDVDLACHSGFMHGAMEVYLAEESPENFAPEIEKLCYSYSTSFKTFECLHGVGHGVMASEEYNLPNAIKHCRSLSTPYNRSACFGGMFMENITTALGQGTGSPHAIRYLNKDPEFPCNVIEDFETIRRQCYILQTSWMEKLFAKDYKKITDICNQVRETKSREGCFKGIGRQASAPKSVDVILERCEFSKVVGVSNDYRNCMIGGLFVLLENWGDRVKDQPQKLCKAVNNEDKAYCYEQLAGRFTGIFGNNTSRKKEVCSYFEKEYIDKCLQINGA